MYIYKQKSYTYKYMTYGTVHIYIQYEGQDYRYVPVQLYRSVTGCGSEDAEVLKALYPSKSPSLWGGGNLVLTSQPVNPDLHIPVHVHLYVYNYPYL